MIETVLGSLAPTDFMLAALAVVAGLARGLTGFGAALIFVPVASMWVGPRMASAMLLVIDTVLAAPLLPRAYPQSDRRDVALTLIGALIAVPVGAAALSIGDATLLRWGICVISLGFFLLLASGWRYSRKPHPVVGVTMGAISGFCAGVAQIGGPPVVAYWLGGQNSMVRVRANFIVYFAVSSLLALASYWFGGLMGTSVLRTAALIGPFYAAGILAGVRSLKILNEATFRPLCLGLILLSAVVGMPLLDGLTP